MTLHAKNRRPDLVSRIVQRPRLYARLDEGASGSAILLSASGGYGKSVLVNEWLKRRSEPVAWLSLDESDNDFRLFLDYLIRAIHSVAPEACPETQERLAALDLPSVADLARCVVDELDGIKSRFFLVLDNLETISNPEIYSLLELFLEYPHTSACLILCTRRDPPFSLSKLQAREQLMENRAIDLAFNGLETEQLVNEIAGFSVSKEALANLEARVEGWPVGLRLVIHVMNRHPDPNGYLLKLDQGPRSVERYFAEEVLSNQSSGLRDCIYKASILDRFNQSLWGAVCRPLDYERESLSDSDVDETRSPVRAGVEDGLFVIPIDAEWHWCRFHPLFSDLLRERLEHRFDADSIAVLHLRASAWFESEGLIQESIRYALSAGNELRAAEIVERNMFDALNSGRGQELASWLGPLPGYLRRNRHGLLMAEAMVAFEEYKLWMLSSILEFAETLDDAPEISAERTLFGGVVSFFYGDFEASSNAFRGLVGRDSDAESWIQIHAYFFIALSLQFQGRGKDAVLLIDAAIERGAGGPHAYGTSLAGTLIYLRLQRGELVEGGPKATQLLESGNERAVGYGSYLLGVSALWRFDLESALEHLSRIEFLHSWLSVDGQIGHALALEMSGRSDEADATMSRIRSTSHWGGTPDQLHQLESAEARIALLRGDVEAARRWQHAYHEDFSIARSSILVEVPELTECRVLATSTGFADLQMAAKKLDKLSAHLKSLHLTCHEMAIAPLHALVLGRLGEEGRAVAILQTSIEMAGSEDWIWPYVEAGPPLAGLLERLPAEFASQPLVKKIRRALAERAGALVGTPIVRGGPSSEGVLTNRELDVLEMLALRLRDKEIAVRLAISTETVKTHLKSLYRKLDTRGRNEAVERARELNLLRIIHAGLEDDAAPGSHGE